MTKEVRRVSVPDRVAEPAVASDPVLYEVRDSGVAVLTLNRPERMNGDVFEASAVAEKLMHESMLRPDFIEGITSFFEKRPPNFPPLSDTGKDS
jgi:enoyl-CoA hydratase/carnithine racemase